MITADVIVIGGGIAGASIAAELSDQLDVTLLEQEPHAGFHATGRSAAVFVPNYGNDTIRALSRESRPQFNDPDDQFWPTPLLSPRGLLRVVREDGLAAYRKQMQGAIGTAPVDLAEAKRLFPILRTDRFVEASYEADVHDIDVDALLQGYLRKARRHRARVEFKRHIKTISRKDELWHVENGTETFVAPFLVNAAGGWADNIAAMAGVPSLGLSVRRRTIAVLPLPDELAKAALVPFTVPFPLDWYAKVEGGSLLVSCAEEEEVEPHDAFADEMTLAEGLHRFEADTTVAVERVERSWAGLRTFSSSGHPVIGFDRNHEGFFWFAGQGGFGVQTAPALASLAVPLIKGQALNLSGRLAAARA